MQVRFLGAVIKPVHPCTGLIARFAQQNALLLRTTDIRVGTEKKTPREQNSSGKKIGAQSAVLHFVFFEVIVNKMQQSAKSITIRIARNTLPEVFPLTIGSGKTKPFEKRRSRYKETAENKAEAYRVYVEHLFSACDAVDARIFSKGDGNMTQKMSTTNLPGGRGNAYPKAELDYSLDYEYDPAYAHRLVHAGNRYYRYDANGNITAEKDGPFTEDDEFVFTYNYDPDTDVYGADYGFGLDAPKETEETHPENLFAYRRNYTWNEKNRLTKSSDRSYTVHYRYGEDGQRALKYTEEGRSETLYFNNFYTIHIPVQDKNNPQGLRVHKHIFVGNSRLVTAMTHTDNNGDNAEQREKRYYYHSDHLGSAQFVTDWRGRQYEHIEYTPYGELWIEEVAAGLDKLPFRFTGKEMDEETGLYYYGARYLDPKYSRWLSGDPALGEYIPSAGTDPSKLAGMGGVYNTVNLHLYHYAGNNPIKYTDPDGKSSDLTIILFPNNEMITGLKTMQNQVLNDPKLKQGAGGPYDRTDSGIKPTATWCNQATYQTTRVTDSTLAKAMYNKGDPNGDNTNAKSIYQNLKAAVQDANSPIMEVPPKTAQILANVGISVVGVKDTNGIGHVATVAPGYKFDKTNGPMMANVCGSDKQGYTRAKSAFRQTYYADGKVHFYINKESLSNLKIVVIKE